MGNKSKLTNNYLFQNNIRFVFIVLFIFNINKSNAQESLVNLSTLSNNFIFEIRYATKNNFIGEKLYKCEICVLRPQVAQALIKANNYFIEKGYRILIYDCYRPLDIQKKMWEKVPRATYVANPYAGGSIHNRGAAVDITIQKLDGSFVEMGTDYDYFGIEAHIDNVNLSYTVLNNRKLLSEGMKKFGFQTIRTEWWHFSYKKNKSFSTLNIPFSCDD